MTTARTHRRNVGRGGAARPRVAPPKPDGFTAVSAETFGAAVAVEAVVAVALDFDPTNHTVEEVKTFVTDNPEQADAVLELELNGKNRSGLLSWLDNFNPENED